MPKPFSDPIWQRPKKVSAFQPQPAVGAVDVVIVGGGIMGLSTALHAARQGLAVQVLDAGAIGEGASGLNGGQVIPGLKYDPEWLVEHFGKERGEALVNFAASTADAVFDLIRDEKLAVPLTRNGWIQAVHTETALTAAANRDRQWRARGADVELLSQAEIAAMTGAKGYLGGWLDRRAGVVDPLAYTLELARVTAAAGAGIAQGQKVVKLRKDAGLWQVLTESGLEVRAKAVVLATNAYTDGLLPGLARTIVPLHSFQIATAPLPADIGAGILPGGQAVSDSRRILVYYRRSADGRLVLGGRGRMALPSSAADWAHLERALIRLYPALAGIAIEKRWFGRVAMTPDHLPHIHEPEKGLLAVAGCQGRGVGLMSALGKRMASYLASGDARQLPFPLSPIRPIPFHAFRQVGVAATIAWYRMLDALER
ncbi:FAD-binding oxidoreductase [Mesorhizobium sp. M4B.F.Ca.ET.190.01.1.1]|uniref:NAD(P)/FAD-dependent oxidoreductase n=1 Tax=unclassified Mesorhizobium TaxID=325217 RepID=UPI000FE50322|nr:MULTISPECIES: FAD-dependent oxidoreductase [unclassified Mesorhizobium]RWF61933.1 MAG: FAD-binding oxidoreductase [Mesorhizobium sp.]TGR15273.1 FAD-binding oxidoreductase [Mesorhizobium sp. M4B.F.Ca.ET.200.01.1.1]TGS23146.1 FAD-binding oxidoreductase [Mesorhizobium sp. M4B.F.Ca.ET.190.01.1.1]TGT33981.1 FAD-binding oxidoreductase [Mesorhizobium sp. M4B.F.Ca.ET.172.01.1.1]TIT43956.1 MAG: FAD-binding oxidoreductase [Mesorhizobium sp.]